jgi:hypothetical protein
MMFGGYIIQTQSRIFISAEPTFLMPAALHSQNRCSIMQCHLDVDIASYFSHTAENN